MFSKACEYGIRASLFIAQSSLNERRVSLKEIAEEIDSPEAFTAKILQQLVKAELFQSIKGPKGGFEVSEAQTKQIMLTQIVQALDGDRILRNCALGLRDCNAANPCPVHDKFLGIREDLKVMLGTTSLYEMASKLEQGISVLRS